MDDRRENDEEEEVHNQNYCHLYSAVDQNSQRGRSIYWPNDMNNAAAALEQCIKSPAFVVVEEASPIGHDSEMRRL